MANAFCELPNELQVAILSNLDAVSIIRSAMTCTSIYDTLKGSSLLQYTIELHRDGLKDAGTSLNYPDLIAALRRRRQAWLRLEIKELALTHLTPPIHGAYELDRLEMLWLPAPSNVKAHALQRASVGVSGVHFTMDPTQDLMVILEEEDDPHTLHIRSISRNDIHPRAQQSPLQWTNIPHTDENGIRLNSVVLQIAYNLLAIFFTMPRGRHKLLDSTYFLITCRSGFGSIRLYRLVRSHRHDANAQATHLATLHLPPTAPGVTIYSIQHESGPIEANPLPGEPFAIHDEDRVHLFTVIYHPEELAEHLARYGRYYFFANLFLHQRLLLKYARGALAEDAPMDVPWAEWGPLHTRFTYSPQQYRSLSGKRYIHGQRAIFSEGETSGRSTSAKIMDFSRAAVSFAKGLPPVRSSAASSPWTRRRKPGVLSLSSTIRRRDIPVFLSDVETHLPCVTSVLQLERTNEMYMIYADGFVGAKYQFNNTLDLNIYPI
ncbi:hypothetical protein BJ912DRAFT_1048308 [Pholiota molesta]|nr:hypothetical protein BJ912DRAFT_1048308 [Pholiota molesta]